MTRPFHQDVESLKMRVTEMGQLARLNLHEGVVSLKELDRALADRVIARNEEINRLDVEIEKAALDLIALHQPMAQDLRTLGASLKILTYLDRIGRYGYDIANVSLAMEGKEHVRKLITIPHMADLAASMLDDALEAYSTRNVEKARGVFPQDDVVDALNDQVFRECITYMMEDPRTISVAAHYILVARHLERAADNAGKIAEKTIYMITGERRLPV